MKIIVTIISTDLGTNLLLSLLVLSYKAKARIWFSASWWSGNTCFSNIAERQEEQNFQKCQRLQYFFRGFPVSTASSLRQVLQTYSEIRVFCSVIRYIMWEVHKKCWRSISKLPLMKLIFQLICIVSSNPQPFPGKASPKVSHLYGTHLPSKNNFQNSPRLDTSATALVYICYSQANQKNSLIED